MNCFYCGKKKRGVNQMFYKLDQDGHIICQSCMSAGYWKDALEIIEHNKQIDKSKKEVNIYGKIKDYGSKTKGDNGTGSVFRKEKK